MGKQTISLGTVANDGTGTTLRDAGNKINANFDELYGGNAFPAGPTAGQRYFRQDRGIDYYYDGTRWLSIQQYALGRGFAGDATANLVGGFPNPFGGLYSIWLERVVYSARMIGGTGTWTFYLASFDGTTATTHDNGTKTTAALATNEFGRFETALGVVLGTTVEGFQFNIDRTSGTLRNGACQLIYRTIG